MLRKAFYIFSIGLLINVLTPFTAGSQTGCPSVDGGPDAEVDCIDPCTELSAEAFDTGGTDSYEVSSITYDPPFSYDDGTSLFIGVDDIYSDALAMPFQFCFFGNAYSDIIVGSNGVMTFDIGEAGAYCPWGFNETAPDAGLPTNAVFGVYYDIDPSDCGEIKWSVQGIEPCRSFVVNYDNVCHFSCGSLTTTTQIVFYETTNVIDIYIEDKPTCSGWNSGNSLLGIQNAAGNTAYVPAGRNTGSWTASNEAWRFTPNGAGIVDIQWFDSEGTLISESNTVEVCPDVPTTYVATAFYDDCGGSVVSVTDEVFVDVTGSTLELADATILEAGIICESDPILDLDAVDPGGLWTADCGDCIDSETGEIYPENIGAGDYIATYTIETDCGPISDDYPFEVFPYYDLEVSEIEPFCFDGSTVDFDAFGEGSWTSDCIGCINGTTGEFNTAVSGPGEFEITYTFNEICNESESTSLIIVDQPSATITAVDTLCESNAAFFMDAEDGGGEWSATCGSCIDEDSGLFDPNIAGPGEYTITYVIDGFCGDSDLQTVAVNQDDDATIVEVGSFCEGFGDVILNSLQSGGQWSATCGTCINPVTGVFNTQDAGVGIHDITYSVGFTCGDQQSISIEVVDNDDSSIDPLIGLCIDTDAQMMTAATSGGTWSATCESCIDSNTGIFDPGMAGPGQFNITYTLPGVCGTTSSIALEVYDLPSVSFDSDGIFGCVPHAVGFEIDGASNGSTYQWDFGNGQFSAAAPNAYTVYENPGCYDVVLNATSAQGCTNSTIVQEAACAWPVPTSAFIYSPVHPDTDNPIVEFQELASGETAYSWNFGNGDYSEEPFPQFNMLQGSEGGSNVCLTAIDDNGCEATACQFVDLLEKLRVFVPNSFSPNQDGINEVWYPVVLGTTFYELVVFNKWGEVVFSSDTPGEVWNGSHQGSEHFSKNDIYIWNLRVVGEDLEGQELTGTVTLFR